MQILSSKKLVFMYGVTEGQSRLLLSLVWPKLFSKDDTGPIVLCYGRKKERLPKQLTPGYVNKITSIQSSRRCAALVLEIKITRLTRALQPPILTYVRHRGGHSQEAPDVACRATSRAVPACSGGAGRPYSDGDGHLCAAGLVARQLPMHI